ncbi:adhesion regulating molecule [Rhizophagus irregularis]|uniref:Adhesion regulating molecule n=1 Tax=Rhizophagus irregularis TaxID=588596 RepID=A0A2I1FTQ2_9GLOM|nr:adhesion regulating molecule [Rhizophagus irregularis]
MATSLFPTPVPRRKYPVEFKAGKLKRDGNTNWLKADERKGLGDDQLMHFYWKDRKNNAVEDDLILFPEEAEFIRVEQCTTGRVYLLNFKSSSRKLFFWMQDAKDDKDEENVAKVNRLINDPQAGLAESRQQQTATSEAGSGVQTTESNLGFTSEQLGNLRNILSGIQVPDVSLVDVLTPSAIGPLLNNPEIASALFPHLPANIERSPEELAAVIQSPQFAQALQSLSIALQSGQLGPLLSQLGLDPSAGNGVEAFLRAIQEQANRRHRDHEDENTEDHSGDRMEED